MSQLFPGIFKPLPLRSKAVLRNRIIMGSMHVGLEEGAVLGGGLDKLAAFYAERAKNGVGLIVTGGIAPNRRGRLSPVAAKMSNMLEMRAHRVVTDAVHQHDGKIAMQILHAGRYAYHPFSVAPSGIKAPISQYTPKALSATEVLSTIQDYAKCAHLAKQAGYDGVEIMGSEGYLINQFLVKHTNQRTDDWGGQYENRMRFPVEIVKAVRQAVGEDFIIIYRLSMLDLIPGGSEWSEILQLAKAIEAAGATIINTGIGWHEARIPTIATCVPRGGFAWVTKKLKNDADLAIPLCTTNRINTPQLADELVQKGYADLISMARPFLADPALVKKAQEGRVEEINTCIACNQACLDHTFQAQRASCLVNPMSGYETELKLEPVKDRTQKKKVAVIGAGPAGLACAIASAQRGHQVVLFEKEGIIGGQFNVAKKVPGKEEFHETLRYFKKMLEISNVDVRLSHKATADGILKEGFDSVVLATGVVPRRIKLPGIDHPKVLSYLDVLKHGAKVGRRVAIIGAGGIGFDMAEFLLHDPSKPPASVDLEAFLREWGIDGKNEKRGGLIEEEHTPPYRDIYLLQRTKGKLGGGLGKTTGWIKRTALPKAGVKMLGGLEYLKVDDKGLHIKTAKGETKVLDVDNVVICAGQEPLRELEQPLVKAGVTVFKIGGAEKAAELDAKRAIDQGTRLAAAIEASKTGDVYNAPPSLEHTVFKKLGIMK